MFNQKRFHPHHRVSCLGEVGVLEEHQECHGRQLLSVGSVLKNASKAFLKNSILFPIHLDEMHGQSKLLTVEHPVVVRISELPHFAKNLGGCHILHLLSQTILEFTKRLTVELKSS